MEQWRLAVICFKMWGELSPTKELSDATMESNDTLESLDNDAAKKKDDDIEQKRAEKATLPPPQTATKRSIGQAEVESAYFKVNFFK